jgi:starch synthase
MSALADFLRSRRWFRAKGRPIAATSERDRAEVGGAALRLCDVAFAEGGGETYLLADDDDAVARALFAAIASEARVEAGRGAFVFRRGPAFTGGAAAERVAPIGGEQTNTSYIIERRFVLKLFRKLEAGESPEAEVLRFLAERTDFRDAPGLAGTIEYESSELGATVGVLSTYIENEGDLWAWTLANRPGAEVFGPLGALLRRLHAALASVPDDPAFAPEPWTRTDLRAAARRFERLLARVAALAARADVRRFAALSPALEARARALGDLEPTGPAKTRIHGDFHLGQVLKTPGGLAVFDFEGEPARALADRRRKRTPLRDVAGMLRSLEYAAALAGEPASAAAAREAFLAGLRLAREAAPLLEVLEVEKAVYELGYELQNRPTWAEVPLAALERLLAPPRAAPPAARPRKVLLLTKEYPPHVYGGAGVHLAHLATELARLCEVEVRCFGAQDEAAGSLRVRGFPEEPGLAGPILDALSRDLRMAADAGGAAIVHSHTWYTAMAGLLAQRLHGLPHVLTTHSLEPLRPWKKEQLGAGGYAMSSLFERAAIEAADAVIAVSLESARDVARAYPAVDLRRVHVIANGIEPAEWGPARDPEPLARRGVAPGRPIVLFVGRATPQKGILELLDAAARLARPAQVVLLAGAPDTPEFGERVRERAREVAAARGDVFLLEETLPQPELRAFYAHASVFCCPSLYEPFGIVNLEAMACEAPVVGAAVGGIPDVVEDGVTGFLVPPGPEFAAGLAARIDALLADPELARRMGRAGRARALARFTWREVAAKTFALYRSVLAESRTGGKA